MHYTDLHLKTFALNYDENCKKYLESDWATNLIKSVKYAVNNSKELMTVFPIFDFTKEVNEEWLNENFK